MFYSIKTKQLLKKLDQIQLFKNIARRVISCFDCPIYIMLVLEEISSIKQLFIYQVELGEEAIVPKCLSQIDLPQSYRFYNPTLRIIEGEFQDHRRNLFIERNQQLLKQANVETDFMTQISKLFRSKSQQVLEAEIDANKTAERSKQLGQLQQKYYRVDSNEIDYLKSPHAMAIQNSNYIKVENNPVRL